jgi:hypothetical protein
MGKLDQIWIKRGKQGPMDPVDSATLDAARGIKGNANRGGRRQVTIITRERWDELMRDLGANLPPSTRRANLMVSGVDLENSRGRILRIGTIRLKINGETKPCEQMEEAHAGLQADAPALGRRRLRRSARRRRDPRRRSGELGPLTKNITGDQEGRRSGDNPEGYKHSGLPPALLIS